MTWPARSSRPNASSSKATSCGSTPGISYAGFHSDFGRTWIVGREPDARQRAQFERWTAIRDAVLDVTRAGATAADLTAAAIEAAGGVKPWMPHFYLGHGLGIDSAEMPYVGSDIGEAFDATLVLAAGMVLVIEPIVWEDGAAGYRSEEVLLITEDGWDAHDRLSLRSVLSDLVTVTEVLPDDAALRLARRARVLAEMEAADIDVLVVGREGNARYVSGAPRLWTAGSRAFGPGCVLVRAIGVRPSAEHLGRRDSRRHPPREPLRDLVQRRELPEGAAGDRRRRDGPDGCHRCHDAVLRAAPPEGVPVGRAHRR